MDPDAPVTGPIATARIHAPLACSDAVPAWRLTDGGRSHTRGSGLPSQCATMPTRLHCQQADQPPALVRLILQLTCLPFGLTTAATVSCRPVIAQPPGPGPESRASWALVRRQCLCNRSVLMRSEELMGGGPAGVDSKEGRIHMDVRQEAVTRVRQPFTAHSDANGAAPANAKGARIWMSGLSYGPVA